MVTILSVDLKSAGNGSSAIPVDRAKRMALFIWQADVISPARVPGGDCFNSLLIRIISSLVFRPSIRVIRSLGMPKSRQISSVC